MAAAGGDVDLRYASAHAESPFTEAVMNARHEEIQSKIKLLCQTVAALHGTVAATKLEELLSDFANPAKLQQLVGDADPTGIDAFPVDLIYRVQAALGTAPVEEWMLMKQDWANVVEDVLRPLYGRQLEAALAEKGDAAVVVATHTANAVGIHARSLDTSPMSLAARFSGKVLTDMRAAYGPGTYGHTLAHFVTAAIELCEQPHLTREEVVQYESVVSGTAQKRTREAEEEEPPKVIPPVLVDRPLKKPRVLPSKPVVPEGMMVPSSGAESMDVDISEPGPSGMMGIAGKLVDLDAETQLPGLLHLQILYNQDEGARFYQILRTKAADVVTTQGVRVTEGYTDCPADPGECARRQRFEIDQAADHLFEVIAGVLWLCNHEGDYPHLVRYVDGLLQRIPTGAPETEAWQTARDQLVALSTSFYQKYANVCEASPETVGKVTEAAVAFHHEFESAVADAARDRTTGTRTVYTTSILIPKHIRALLSKLNDTDNANRTHEFWMHKQKIRDTAFAVGAEGPLLGRIHMCGVYLGKPIQTDEEEGEGEAPETGPETNDEERREEPPPTSWMSWLSWASWWGTGKNTPATLTQLKDVYRVVLQRETNLQTVDGDRKYTFTAAKLMAAIETERDLRGLKAGDVGVATAFDQYVQENFESDRVREIARREAAVANLESASVNAAILLGSMLIATGLNRVLASELVRKHAPLAPLDKDVRTALDNVERAANLPVGERATMAATQHAASMVLPETLLASRSSEAAAVDKTIAFRWLLVLAATGFGCEWLTTYYKSRLDRPHGLYRDFAPVVHVLERSYQNFANAEQIGAANRMKVAVGVFLNRVYAKLSTSWLPGLRSLDFSSPLLDIVPVDAVEAFVQVAAAEDPFLANVVTLAYDVARQGWNADVIKPVDAWGKDDWGKYLGTERIFGESWDDFKHWDDRHNDYKNASDALLALDALVNSASEETSTRAKGKFEGLQKLAQGSAVYILSTTTLGGAVLTLGLTFLAAPLGLVSVGTAAVVLATVGFTSTVLSCGAAYLQQSTDNVLLTPLRTRAAILRNVLLMDVMQRNVDTFRKFNPSLFEALLQTLRGYTSSIVTLVSTGLSALMVPFGLERTGRIKAGEGEKYQTQSMLSLVHFSIMGMYRPIYIRAGSNFGMRILAAATTAGAVQGILLRLVPMGLQWSVGVWGMPFTLAVGSIALFCMLYKLHSQVAQKQLDRPTDALDLETRTALRSITADAISETLNPVPGTVAAWKRLYDINKRITAGLADVVQLMCVVYTEDTFTPRERQIAFRSQMYRVLWVHCWAREPGEQQTAVASGLFADALALIDHCTAVLVTYLSESTKDWDEIVVADDSYGYKYAKTAWPAGEDCETAQAAAMTAEQQVPPPLAAFVEAQKTFRGYSTAQAAVHTDNNNVDWTLLCAVRYEDLHAALTSTQGTNVHYPPHDDAANALLALIPKETYGELGMDVQTTKDLVLRRTKVPLKSEFIDGYLRRHPSQERDLFVWLLRESGFAGDFLTLLSKATGLRTLANVRGAAELVPAESPGGASWAAYRAAPWTFGEVLQKVYSRALFRSRNAWLAQKNHKGDTSRDLELKAKAAEVEAEVARYIAGLAE